MKNINKRYIVYFFHITYNKYASKCISNTQSCQYIYVKVRRYITYKRR